MNKSVHKAEYGRKSNRKIVLLCLLLVCIFIVGGIASMNAYFIDMKTSQNTFTVGHALVEVSDDSRIVVENTGSVTCYVRVFAKPENPGHTFAYDESNWTLNGDYYYYKDTLASTGYEGSASQPLIAGGGKIPADENYIVYAECIQSLGFDSAIQAFTMQPDDGQN